MNVYALVVSVAIVGVYVWQDGIMGCADGDRYISGQDQPSPFHRRFHAWPRYVLQAATYASLLMLGVMMGTPTKAALLLALPGAWFIATHPTCVDAPCVLLAWLSSLVAHSNPALSVALACGSGFVHERGPVFASLYALSPWPLLGLVCVGWWRKPISSGPGMWTTIKGTRPYQDLLDGKILLVGLRGLLPIAAYDGMPVRAWLSLAVAFASRVIGTDTCRFLFWAAPPMVADARDVPMWYLALHIVTFRRAI